MKRLSMHDKRENCYHKKNIFMSKVNIKWWSSTFMCNSQKLLQWEARNSTFDDMGLKKKFQIKAGSKQEDLCKWWLLWLSLRLVTMMMMMVAFGALLKTYPCPSNPFSPFNKIFIFLTIDTLLAFNCCLKAFIKQQAFGEHIDK